MDAQSVKTVEESAGICGFDAHKHVKGRKRHLLVDTLGIPISIYITPADVHDTREARCLLAGLQYFVPRLTKIWADAAYRGQELAEWCKTTGEWDLEVVERAPDTRGFSMVPKTHGLRNEMHILLKRLCRTVQCSRSFWAEGRNTSALWKWDNRERDSLAQFLLS